ncbi:hypothetical protein [Nocardia caishijiensis]|uniref:hypothetical protein n=1 Tax=Nocardia caishijiensis TaxID=184756 RepID=UPI0012ECCC5A|nr:hypothetical protein [Nocardia caishijiensis]
MDSAFDFNDPEVIADPYPSYALLREEAPVYHSRRPDLWIVSRYDDVRTVVRDAHRFSSAVSAIGSDPFDPAFEPPRWLSAAFSRIPAVRVLLTSDPPDNTMLRRKVSRTFTARLVDALPHENPDPVRDLAAPLPAIIIADLLEVPPERQVPRRQVPDRHRDGLLASWCHPDLPPVARLNRSPGQPPPTGQLTLAVILIAGVTLYSVAKPIVSPCVSSP